MLTVGIRELKTNPSVILRRVRLKGETVDITFRGKIIARISPAQSTTDAPARDNAAWVALDRISAEIGVAVEKKKKTVSRRRVGNADLHRDL